MNQKKITVQDVHKTFAQANASIPILNGVNATFLKGSSYGITGVSGSGKSTLMHLLAGLDKPDAGLVCFNDISLANLSENQKSIFLNTSIGLVFQYPYLIKELSVQENVMIKGLIAGKNNFECAQQAKKLLADVGLGDKIHAYPGQLSGGQQQRVSLARALMNQPDFLLLDEPTGNLDIHTGTLIVDLILRLQHEWNMGIIISSHDAYVADRMDVLYELTEGRLYLKKQ